MPKAPVDHIRAPAFPRDLPWINVAALRMDQQRGRPVLIEFWDFCRPNSMRTLPYMRAWHERYADAGLRVIGVHSAGFGPSVEANAVEAAVDRLAIEYPVVVDVEHQIWQEYENLGWPARYLWSPELTLSYYHLGEGAYGETELEIRSLLGLNPVDDDSLVGPFRREDAPNAELVVPTPDVEGLYSGPYEAGGVWGVFDGTGTATVNGHTVTIDNPGAHELVSHNHHTTAVLELTTSAELECLAVCFTPGLAGS